MQRQRSEKSDGRSGVRDDQRVLIQGLNDDLAREYQAVMMYVQYSATVTGPYRRTLREFFGSEIADELRHAQLLSDKIVALGGSPTVELRPVPNGDDPREMLQRALELEEQAVAGYTERVDQAASAGQLGLKVDVENLVADETRHKEEIERFLAGWDRNDS